MHFLIALAHGPPFGAIQNVPLRKALISYEHRYHQLYQSEAGLKSRHAPPPFDSTFGSPYRVRSLSPPQAVSICVWHGMQCSYSYGRFGGRGAVSLFICQNRVGEKKRQPVFGGKASATQGVGRHCVRASAWVPTLVCTCICAARKPFVYSFTHENDH